MLCRPWASHQKCRRRKNQVPGAVPAGAGISLVFLFRPDSSFYTSTIRHFTQPVKPFVISHIGSLRISCRIEFVILHIGIRHFTHEDSSFHTWRREKYRTFILLFSSLTIFRNLVTQIQNTIKHKGCAFACP